jgi:hypothetical protein
LAWSVTVTRSMSGHSPQTIFERAWSNASTMTRAAPFLVHAAHLG